MSKVAFFGHISPNSLTTFFRKPPNFLGTSKIFSASPNFFTLLDLDILLDFLDLKIFSNQLNSLQKHLLNLQSDEKNYIFNFSIYSKKLP